MICEKFGCSKVLSLQESLFGNTCIECNGNKIVKIVDKTIITEIIFKKYNNEKSKIKWKTVKGNYAIVKDAKRPHIFRPITTKELIKLFKHDKI